jgi:beta-lactamase superfamily II metal-dependent hydrolase
MEKEGAEGTGGVMMAPQTSAEPTMKPPKPGVTVRMYDLHGEGDCFLLAFRAKDDTQGYMLIDCGIFMGTSGAAERLRDIAKDIAEATGNHLHLLVTTHEHWDHLAGFQHAKDIFFGDHKIAIDEVWLAWTEDLEHSILAKTLHDKYEGAAMALTSATMQLEKLNDPWVGAIRDVLAYHSPQDFEGALGMTTNELMNNVDKVLSGGTPHYRYPSTPPITTSAAPGVRFYTLGPPQDERLLKILEGDSALRGAPLALDEATAFYSAVLAAHGDKERRTPEQAALWERSCPFGDHLGMTEDQARNYKVNGESFFEEHYGFEKKDPEKDWRRIDSDWLATAGQLALNMDAQTNNTSLVLALELIDSGKVLLFPGDAQAGNWLSWKDTSFTVEDKDGKKMTITGMDLVQRVAFYKVAHHGSQNATRVDYLKMMRDDLVAMIPVNEKWANETMKWEHPGKALLEELKKKTSGRIIRADTRLPDEVSTGLSQIDWKEFIGNVEEDQSPKKLWIQYTVQG